MAVGSLRCIVIDVNALREAEQFWGVVTGLRLRYSGLDHGISFRGSVRLTSRPLIPTLITENIEALQDVGAMLRRAEAAALRAHGYTMERIADLFGVTRQRIYFLLQSHPGAGTDVEAGPAG